MTARAAAPADERTAARRRHPAARVAVDLSRFTTALERQLAEAGAPYPRVGAAAITARGRSGLDLERFAGLGGTDPRFLASVEAGLVDQSSLPGHLRLLIGCA